MRLRALAALVLIGSASVAPSGQQPAIDPAGAVDGEILVKFRPQADDGRRDQALNRVGGRRIRRFKDLDIDHVLIPRGGRAEEAVAAILGDPDVVAAQPNYLRRLSFPAPPNDPFWVNSGAPNNFYNIKRIDADLVWSAYTKGSAAIVVADIDTGVRYDHPDLAANMWTNPGEIPGNLVDDDGNGYVDDVFGIDTINHDSNPIDDHGHGTHTAGTIGGVGNNGIGVVGVNWTVKMLACKFLDAAGNGTDAGAIECFNYITALKNAGVNVRVSNNSWGSYRNTSAPFPQLLKNAIDAAGNAGIINIFAAGNGDAAGNPVDIDIFPHDPASFDSPSIISVAAANRLDDGRATFSNYGDVSVDLAAPGVDIISTWIPAPPTCTVCYARLNGTSMATPHVAGVAALLLARSAALPVAGIKSLILGNVVPIAAWSGFVATGGRLSAWNPAVALNANQAPSVSITSPLAGTTYVPPATFAFGATASDTGGVDRVEFFANGGSLGVDSSTPYSITVSGLTTGTYSLTVVATDNLGAQATSPPVPIAVGIPEAEIVAAVSIGGTRLQQLQNADGGWYFRAADSGCGLGAGVSCPNIVGITGLGLLSAYDRTGDPTLLADAIAAGELLESIRIAAPQQQPFSQDLEFLRALSVAAADEQFATLATDWFTTITAVHPNAADRADWAFTRRDSQRRRSLAVWDLASTIRSAKAAGRSDYAVGLANRVIAREAEWKNLDPAHRWDQCAVPAGCGPADNPLAFDYTLLGMGSFIWAVHDLPGFSGTISDYRAWLLSQQDDQGTWDAGDLQITSYIAMGLGAAGGAGTDIAIQDAVGFFIANRQPAGGWPFAIFNGIPGVEVTTVDSEIIRAIDLLYSTASGLAVTVAPAQLATLAFDAVTAAGRTTVVATTATPAHVPPHYTLVDGLTYEAATTAQVSGEIVMCLSVPWNSLSADFDHVRLLQPRRRVDRLTDRTILKGPFGPDASARRVCAKLDSLEPVSVSILNRGRK